MSRPNQISLTVPVLSSKTQTPSPSDERKNTSSATGNPRNKCALKPGHSLMDWIRLGASGIDLAGNGGRPFTVSHAELAKHNTAKDAWLAVRGKVYNVTRYLDFHPGGVDELMKGIGKDATKMFDEVHAWVNYEQLLGKCFVGPLRTEAVVQLASPLRMPPPKLFPVAPSEVVPRFDWMQQRERVTLIFYTKAYSNPAMLIEQSDNDGHEADQAVGVRISITLDAGVSYHECVFKFQEPVQWPCTTRLNHHTGKVEIGFMKCVAALWTSFGCLERRKRTGRTNDDDRCPYERVCVSKITHDSYAVALRPTTNRRILLCPVGYHIDVTALVEDCEITRSYTPISAGYFPTTEESSDDTVSLSNILLLVKSYTTGMLSNRLTASIDLPLNVSMARGNFVLNRLNERDCIGLIAAGSGITPILSVIDYLLACKSGQPTAIHLLYFNKTEEDIWCSDRLEKLATNDKRLKIKHILSQPNDDLWPGTRGHLTDELITPILRPNAQSYLCVCGPPAFNKLCRQILDKLQHSESDVHFFAG